MHLLAFAIPIRTANAIVLAAKAGGPVSTAFGFLLATTLTGPTYTTTAGYAGRNTGVGGTRDGNFRIRDLVTRGWLIVARDRAVCVRQFMVRGIGATFGRQISMGKIPTHFVGVELACDVTGTPLGANKQALNETLGSRRDAGIALFFSR